jgi:thioester reductase-like protein
LLLLLSVVVFVHCSGIHVTTTSTKHFFEAFCLVDRTSLHFVVRKTSTPATLSQPSPQKMTTASKPTSFETLFDPIALAQQAEREQLSKVPGRTTTTTSSYSLDYSDPRFDHLCIQDLFLNQVRKTPNAIAICDPYAAAAAAATTTTFRGREEKHNQTEWTYQEIHDLSDRFACYLIQQHSVQPDAVVGLLLPRSALYVVAYIAILKAGGAYMPLELVYPKSLLEQAVDQTQAKLVITTSTYVDRIVSKPHLVLDSVTALSEFLTTLEAPTNHKNNDTIESPVDSPLEEDIQQQQRTALLWSNRPTADHLAFVVMSSGTTGKPKGICQVHRAAVHAYTDRLVRYPYHRVAGTTTDGNGVVQDRDGAGVFFSWECYRPLCGGATCVVIPDHVLFDAQAVTKFVKTHGITRLLVTPSLLQLIWNSVDAQLWQEHWASLRLLWYCGEVVSMPLATAVCQLFPKLSCLNLYSISECHDVSIGDLNQEVAALAVTTTTREEEQTATAQSTTATKYATCGNAMPGVQIYVVNLEEDHDDNSQREKKVLRLVPAGETGEVYVGGPGMGRGYLHMPEKTLERFVPNPFDTTGRFPTLYRTGDLGRISESHNDGKGPQLEILGRCDFMVKLRGYSVVLGAIETALSKHSQVASAVVVAVGQEGSMDKQLVAYVVPKQWDNPPSAASVRSFLKYHVPPYAIPSIFCVLEALPVHQSAAGKVDRKKLPPLESAPRLRAFSVDSNDAEAEETYKGDLSSTTALEYDSLVHDSAAAASTPRAPARLPPQTLTEQLVLQVWANLLEMPAKDFSVLDSFFEVGGHSLLATRMVSHLNDQMGKKNVESTANDDDGDDYDDYDDDDDQSGQVITIVDVMQGPTIREIAAKIDSNLRIVPVSSMLEVSSQQPLQTGTTLPPQEKIDLMAEANALDPSICPVATRQGDAMFRFRSDGSTLLPPSIVFLTGATGYLGVHILAEMLLHCEEVFVVCLVRAPDDQAAKARVMSLLEQFGLDQVLNNTKQQAAVAADGGHALIDWVHRFMGVAGDLSRPLLGMDSVNFKSLAVEIDSIIHCGAFVNLVQPYQVLKAANVLGTQEILRLATTNGFVKTKVKPVHYISTNGIFSVKSAAYKNDDAKQKIRVCPEDIDLTDQTIYNDFMTQGYGMTKWVAEKMCTIAESRGLPISVMRPGNMGPCTYTTNLNKDDFVVLFVNGIIEMGCAPDADPSLYAVDWTPVDFAARAVVQLAVQAPMQIIGQRLHLQASRDPISLSTFVSWLRDSGHVLESVSSKEWILRLHRAAEKLRQEANGSESGSVLQRLESGWDAFEPYFKASTWLRYGNKNLQNALQAAGSDIQDCNPRLDLELFTKWFPLLSGADTARGAGTTPPLRQ